MKLFFIVAALCGVFRVSQESYDGLDRTIFTVEAKDIVEAIRKAKPSPERRIIKIEEVMNAFEIYADGKAYSGESDLVENAPPTVGVGWTGKGPSTRSGIVWGGEPWVCEGERNLRSHLERIMRRDLWMDEIVIRKVPEKTEL